MGIGSMNIRVALWMPLDSADASRASDEMTLARHLAQHYDIEIIFDAQLTPPIAVATATKLVPHTHYQQRHRNAPYDIDIYFIKASYPRCGFIYTRLLAQAGVVILTDESYLPLYRGLAQELGDARYLFEEIEHQYGQDTAASIATQTATADERTMPMTRRIGEHAWALLTSVPTLYQSLSQQHPDTPLYLLPPLNTANETQWATISAALQQTIDGVLFNTPPAGRSEIIRGGRRATGLNIIADVEVSAGLGAAALSLMNAALDRGIPISYTEQRHGFWRRNVGISSRIKQLSDNRRYPINLLCSNINEMHQITPTRMSELTNDRYTIASWFWEMPQIPAAYSPEFQRVDEIWVATHYTQRAMATVAQVPVRVIPVPVELATSPTISRDAFGIPDDRFVFLFTFSAVSCSARKNPFGLIHAFRRAFSKEANRPLLVLKAHHLDLLPELQLALRQEMEAIGGLLIEAEYTRQQTNDLMACADCYVSLHRAEGYGLGMAEAMYLGVPVIATNYSGNVDFTTADTSYLVDYHLRPITAYDHRFQTDCLAVYEPGQLWAEPNSEHAAHWMSYVFTHRDEARQQGRRGAVAIRRHCSPQVIGRLVEQRLIEIEERPRGGQAPSYLAEHVDQLWHRHAELLSDLKFTRNGIEALPFSDRPQLHGLVQRVARNRNVALFLRVIKRIRWMGKLAAQQEALFAASSALDEALSRAIFGANTTLPSVYRTIAKIENAAIQVEHDLRQQRPLDEATLMHIRALTEDAAALRTMLQQ